MDNSEQKAFINWISLCPHGCLINHYDIYPILGEASIRLEKIKVEKGEDDE
jgi:hypothetical protein